MVCACLSEEERKEGLTILNMLKPVEYCKERVVKKQVYNYVIIIMILNL